MNKNQFKYPALPSLQPQFVTALKKLNKLNDSAIVRAFRTLNVNNEALAMRTRAFQNSATESLVRAFKAADVVLEGLNSLPAGTFDRIFKVFSKLDSDVHLKTLATHGWFIDGGMSYSEMIEVAELFEVGQHAEAEARLVDNFEQRASEICKELTAIFPERSNALKQAFEAHEKEMYFASIPVMLIQADGICKTKCNFSVYKIGNNNKLKIVELADKQISENAPGSFVMAQFDDNAPIFSNFVPGQTQYNRLGRHAVIHGVDTEYGTKINSLKAISWLGYVALALSQPDEEEAA